MDIGIIGAGTLAQAFAKKALDAGHKVVFSNSRGPQSLSEVTAKFGPRASAATVETAAQMPIVLLALPWPKVVPALRGLIKWDGQVLIDATNAFKDGTPTSGVVNFHDDSSSEAVARLAAGARVVKAMNSMFMSNFANEPTEGQLRRAIFISGDDNVARNTVADLFESLGFAPIVLGNLKEGGRTQSVGGPIAGHDFFVPWPAPRFFPPFGDVDPEA